MHRSCGEENNFSCQACHHDESFHEIIGSWKARKSVILASQQLPQLLSLCHYLLSSNKPLKVSVERFSNLHKHSKSSTGGTKRPLSRGADHPPRTLMSSSTSRSSELNTTVHIVVMERSANVPITHLERVEIRHDYFENTTLSTSIGS
jgi:hypothetical protein